ncbi:MAG: glycoside hydrolase family 97 catalytic domain-containing protein [Prevotella sp.]|nr:glycoside hydrolase family 97 catalytic domain-containing protein [Prevotella sp.]
MRKLLFSLAFMMSVTMMADDKVVSSPDGRLVVTISCNNGKASYGVKYDGMEVLKTSSLGLKTNVGDFTKGLKMLADEQRETLRYAYLLSRSKYSSVSVVANQLKVNFETEAKIPMCIVFCVKDNDVAFKYQLGRGPKDNPKCAVVYEETTAFNFPDETRTFLCPQITPMTGWERTKPSYEEEYEADAPMNQKSKFGVGYTFPCLFRVPQISSANGKLVPQTKLWILVSETGVSSAYCGARLSDYESGRGYTVAYPQKGENNGFGSEFAGIMLPGETPWRTITVGNNLKPIVETTVPFDFVKPLYEPSINYQPGRYTWSWLVWQDNSINYDDQVKFIDLAAAQGYEYTLVDNWWDTQIGHEKIEKLSEYAQSKGVHLMLWFNSNGFENDAPQGPRNIMSNSIARKKEMAWMQKIGVKGIKVDFFGGDKQETMRLYEEILSDANDYGIQVIFHGCTMPRGWERMYPNYVGSEGALASENVYFTDYHAKKEGFEMTMHPFSRNAVAAFDWGGVIMNRYLSRDNKSRHQRFTSDVFEMATAITNQCSVNCIAMQPNNLNELPQFELDFLRQIPTSWDETRFIDGYPTRYVVIARRTGNQWYVGGLNGTDQPITLTLQLPMFAGKTVQYYVDEPKKAGEILPTSALKSLKVNKKGEAKVTIQPMGGIILR